MQVAKACDGIEGLHYFHTSNMVWANHETHSVQQQFIQTVHAHALLAL